MLPLLFTVLVVSFFIGFLLGDRTFLRRSNEAAGPARELPDAADLWSPCSLGRLFEPGALNSSRVASSGGRAPKKANRTARYRGYTGCELVVEGP